MAPRRAVACDARRAAVTTQAMIAAWIAILTRQQTAPTVSWPCMAAASAILARKAIGLVPAPSAQGVADRGQATIVSGSAQLPSHGRDRSLALHHLPPMDGS